MSGSFAPLVPRASGVTTTSRVVAAHHQCCLQRIGAPARAFPYCVDRRRHRQRRPSSSAMPSSASAMSASSSWTSSSTASSSSSSSSPPPTPKPSRGLAIEAIDATLFFSDPNPQNGAGGTGTERRKRALDGATLRVPRGHLHVLLGPNGCGKSTLLRALGGLGPPLRSGTVAALGPVAFVFQNPDHQVVLPTAGADVAFGLGRLAGLLPDGVAQRRSERALAAVGLGGGDGGERGGRGGTRGKAAGGRGSSSSFGSRPVHTLSGGQKQRVAVAGALAQAPRVLLLDELTTFLDAEDAAGVLAAVKAAISSGRRRKRNDVDDGESDDDDDSKNEESDGESDVTALWVTHRLDELRAADSASLMESGKIVATGDPRAVAEELRRRGAVVPHW